MTLLSRIPALSSPQHHLLKSFTVPHSVPHFEIAGPTNRENRTSIAAQNVCMASTVGGCLDEVIDLSDKGHEKHIRKDLEGRKESLQCGLY